MGEMENVEQKTNKTVPVKIAMGTVLVSMGFIGFMVSILGPMPLLLAAVLFAIGVVMLYLGDKERS